MERSIFMGTSGRVAAAVMVLLMLFACKSKVKTVGGADDSGSGGGSQAASTGGDAGARSDDGGSGGSSSGSDAGTTLGGGGSSSSGSGGDGGAPTGTNGQAGTGGSSQTGSGGTSSGGGGGTEVDASDVIVAAGQDQPFGIALDDREVYWSNEGAGTIVKCPKTGCGSGGPTLLTEGQPGVRGIALHGSRLYWVTDQDQLMSCEVAACADGESIEIGSSIGSPWGWFGVAVDEQRVYVAAHVGLYACPTSGCGGEAPLAIAGGGGIRSVALSSGRAYFSGVGRRHVASCPVGGCGSAQEELVAHVSNVLFPTGVVVDGTTLHWAQYPYSPEDYREGAVRSCTLPDCDEDTTRVLVAGSIGPVGMAADATHLYFADQLEGRIVAVSKERDGSEDCVPAHLTPCGDCGGITRCDGECSAPTPTDLGMPCGDCGGSVQCDGTCSIGTPLGHDQPCGTCSGRFECSGRCSIACDDPRLEVYGGAAGAYEIVTGADGKLWFTTQDPAIVSLDPLTGELTQVPVGGEGGTRNITTGPDQSIWVARASGVGVVKVVGDSVTDNPTLPAYAIAQGPDGNMWVTDPEGQKLRVLSQQAVQIREVSVGVSPWHITMGSDNALWVTTSASTLLRVDISGDVAEHQVPGRGSLEQIVSGPDGDLWIARGDSIVRLTLGMSPADAPEFFLGGGPLSLTVSADGSVWFVARTGHKIGSIAITGIRTEFALPDSANPSGGIAQGPDGALWIAGGFPIYRFAP
jgi:streptogramin lyase